MNTRLLMISSAVILGATGILLIFMPEEVAHFFKFAETATILFQILGALYFGFAMLNWTAKANLIGGIYSRPVCIANFTHFSVGGLALIKMVLHHNYEPVTLSGTILYLIFAVFFGYVFFTTPNSRA